MLPGPLSLRRLVWMLEAKQIDEWNHTASVICWTVKAAVGKKARSLKPKMFHPLAGKTKSKRKLSREESRRRLDAMVGLSEKNG